MKAASIAAMVALVAACGLRAAESDESCPRLPASSGLHWKAQRGPDFDLCYAYPAEREHLVFGLYLGHAPAYHPNPEQRPTAGEIGGHPVGWIVATGKDGDFPFGLETVFEIGTSGLKVHAWTHAQSREEQQRALAVLRALRFREDAAPRP